MRHSRLGAVVVAMAVSPVAVFGAELVDNFNSAASAANYTVVTSDATSSFATFGYDYSQQGIPSAPNSGDGSTRGLRLDANSAAPNAAEAVTLHTLLSFTGDYSVKFDAWINVNGPFPDGGSGSTNSLTAGVGGNGTSNNHIIAAATGSGAWTAVNGDNGNGFDYRMYKGTTRQEAATGQYAAGTGNGTNAYYAQFGGLNIANFPVQGANNGGPAQQTGTSGVGTFGMAWHQVELLVDADGGTGGAASVKWLVDGLLIGTLDAGANGTFTSNGSVTLGYSDPTSNLSDNPPLSFVLFDNLRVSVPEPATAGLVVPAVMAVAARRRRRA